MPLQTKDSKTTHLHSKKISKKERRKIEGLSKSYHILSRFLANETKAKATMMEKQIEKITNPNPAICPPAAIPPDFINVPDK